MSTPHDRKLPFQRIRRLYCRLRGHRWLQPFEAEIGDQTYVVRGCKRCGANTLTPVARANRKLRRHVERQNRRKKQTR